MIWSALVFIFVQLHGLVNMGNAKQVNGHPNIVFILADDIGVADFGYSSQVDDIATPNVDFLAKSGIVLENYYVHALCTPTRASILTGRYSINTGLTSVLIVGMFLRASHLYQYLISFACPSKELQPAFHKTSQPCQSSS